ncbi:hypothetical protein MO973_09675 [Paenibacillus sp. TRM 82003]|uniref:hypothetical protein n=1 Tax=Kineococcus sp. TRM81007 TaxID=2925831 RepID=UPI001F57AA08|nr:hypothetical protein [Kineococcus sp. TRM81007]MCI2238116.1 hypothetical protein [Kineococcus sp. TRM81007]MCI3920500.1 hypothetical protein [Paenibacillus sp. TRM 82003]
MAQADLLRDSRDGDQFHYHWAARQALRLLQPGTDLAAIVIEGVSTDDTADTSGDEVVDLAEYWGSLALGSATKVIYKQLKHSTEAPDKERTSSYLRKTLIGFAKKYRSVLEEYPSAADRVWFEFVSVPPLADQVRTALEDIQTGRDALAPRAAQYIREQLGTSLTDEQSRSFVSRLILRDREPGLVSLRQELRSQVSSFLPGAAAAHDLLLREMVSTRASSIAGFDPIITRTTVLSTLQATEDDLLPAPNLIDTPAPVIELPQVAELAQILVDASAPVLAHATGGMGKSVLASTIGGSLPRGSVTLVYDCFGAGTYRRLSSRRHEHRQAFLQLSNELAAKGLCGPVLPSDTANSRAYMRIFLDRVATAARTVAENSPEAILLLVIDAADNAVMAAGDAGTAAFVSDLIREDLPSCTRLLILCRTERRSLLNPPPACIDVPLRGFNEEHSTAHLTSRFGPASKADGAEFHRLTHGNPRVQALVMQNASSVESVLQSLGEVQHDGSDLFADLMTRRLNEIREEFGGAADQIDRLCRAMAALRPRIPVDVLAAIAGVEPTFIRSFAAEFDRSIFFDQDTVQFRDEPTETWFRSTFRPSRDALLSLIGDVRPLAEVHPYLSATLPQLLYEAGLVRELVDLALSSDGLAAASDLEQREIAHQRAQFALKAALRDGREVDAARLAWTAGGLHAGETRRVKLIRGNTDLAGEFLDGETIDSLLAGRALAGEWPGSHLHMEGALLAATGDVHLARNRLRSAQDWMRQWIRQAVARGEDHKVSDDDIAELAYGILTVSGAAACVDFLGAWSPSWVAYQVGRRVAGRLVDRNKVGELEELAVAAGKVERLQLAVVSVALEAGVLLGPAAVRRTIRMLKKHRAPINLGAEELTGLGAGHRAGMGALPIAWVLSLGTRHGVVDMTQARRIIMRYLPATLGHDAGSWFDHGAGTRGLLFAFTLDSVLRDEELDVSSIAPPGVRKDWKASGAPRTRQLADFTSNVLPLTRWMRLYVEAVTREAPDAAALSSQFDALAGADFKTYGDYETPRLLINSIARLAVRLLSQLPVRVERNDFFNRWATENFRHLTWATVIDVVRISSRCEDLHELNVELAALLRDALQRDDSPAEERYEALVSLARATYAFDPEESRADFDRALEITSRLGEDVHDRWRALGRIAEHACGSQEQPAQAYRLAQVAESLQSYLGGDSTVAIDVLPQIQGFSAAAGVAIAARWRDRRVASLGQLARALTSSDAAPTSADPRWALGMLPMGAEVSHAHLNRLGPPGSAARADAEAVIDEWFRPLKSSGSAMSSTALGGTADSSHITADAFRSDPEELLTAELFADFDLTTPASWDAAVRVAGDGRREWLRKELLLDHAARCPLNRLRTVLEAAADSSLMQPHDYNGVIERLAARPGRLPQAARGAVAQLIDRLVERFAKKMTASGYDPIDLQAVESLCGRTPASVGAEALRQLGSVPELLTSRECYELVARLTSRAHPSDNAAVLTDALESFSQVAAADACDGSFEHLPVPPEDLAVCIAAFVWCAAGDPAKTTRWNAAHTIRLWVALGCTDLVESLVRCAIGDVDVTAFVGSGLVFYDKHALMWTVMALARACDDHRSLASLIKVTPLVPLLHRIIFTDPPNAVLQHSARDVLRRLHEVGDIALTPEELQHLITINRPAVIVEEQYGSRPMATSVRLDGPSTAADPSLAGEKPQLSGRSEADTRFSFFMDFQDHWCGQLGRAFGVTGQRVLQLVDEVIVDRWRSPFRGGIDDDHRHGLKLYGDGGTYVHKFSWPEEEDLDFYLALHALYQVAGHLARHYPVYRSSKDDRDDFAQWLDDHVPTRHDGRWVFDRRDPVPAHLARTDPSSQAGSSELSRSEWLCDVPASRFTPILAPSDGWVTLDGNWTATFWDRYETVTVRSALVEQGVARALVAALRTAPDLHAIHLPSESDHDDIPTDLAKHYCVLDAVEDSHPGAGIDTHDPNAAGINWPPTRPSGTVVAALELTADRDLREWGNARGHQVTTSVWSTGSERGSSGHRIQIRGSALAQLLTSEQRALIVSIRISRSIDSRYRPADEDDATQARQPHIKFFLLRADGTDVEFVD